MSEDADCLPNETEMANVVANLVASECSESHDNSVAEEADGSVDEMAQNLVNESIAIAAEQQENALDVLEDDLGVSADENLVVNGVVEADVPVGSGVVNPLVIAEQQLQSSMQLLAILNAKGPGKDQKCLRPFSGEQQLLYDDLLPICTDIHVADLKCKQVKAECDLSMQALEARLISKGLQYFSKKNESHPESILGFWHYEMLAFQKAVDAMMQQQTEMQNETLLKMLSMDQLCFNAVFSEKALCEEVTFTTRRKGRDFVINISHNYNSDVWTDCDDQLKGIDSVVRNAFAKKCTMMKLVRSNIWPLIDDIFYQ